jgi:hypothetical protein
VARIEEAALHDRLEWDTPLFRTALAQYEQARPYAGVPLVTGVSEVAAALDARGLYP